MVMSQVSPIRQYSSKNFIIGDLLTHEAKPSLEGGDGNTSSGVMAEKRRFRSPSLPHLTTKQASPAEYPSFVKSHPVETRTPSNKEKHPNNKDRPSRRDMGLITPRNEPLKDIVPDQRVRVFGPLRCRIQGIRGE